MLSNVEKGAGKKNVELSLPPVTTIVILKKKGGPTREVRCSSLDSRRIWFTSFSERPACSSFSCSWRR